MLTGLEHSELLTESLTLGSWEPSIAIQHELAHLALTQNELPFLTASVFDLLRKKSGQAAAVECLGAIQVLASQGTVAGARLLAAFLNVSTPGERLVPHLRPLDSSRRYDAILSAQERELGVSAADWQRRLRTISAECGSAAGAEPQPAAAGPAWGGPRENPPWPLLRASFASLVSRASSGELPPGSPECRRLANLMRLEIDAWQERVSRLAGSIDPFRVATVSRVLPMLNRADAEIRDLLQMTAWVNEGDFESAFIKPQPRWRETLNDKDWAHLLRDLGQRPELAWFGQLARGLASKPVLGAQLATGVRRVVSLSELLVGKGVRSQPLDLFTACLLAQSHYGNGQIVFTVEKELAEVLEPGLPGPDEPEHPLSGVSLVAGLLVIELSESLPEWAHGLPVLRETTLAETTALSAWRYGVGLLGRAELALLAEQGIEVAAVTGQAEAPPAADAEEEGEKDLSASALKHLVLTNIQSVSVLLGFLRNPKVFGIPGLVADVAVRTRNPQVLAVIATDRALHTGYANKGVPMACLRSPVNVSVKILRKFCHVKYISKTELKRMAADRTGIRKDVAREIEMYLEALA